MLRKRELLVLSHHLSQHGAQTLSLSPKKPPLRTLYQQKALHKITLGLVNTLVHRRQFAVQGKINKTSKPPQIIWADAYKEKKAIAHISRSIKHSNLKP